MPVKKSKSTKRRTEVKDLPKRKKELSNEEQKNVKGGSGFIKSVEGGDIIANTTGKRGGA